jgi:hypothetical protein
MALARNGSSKIKVSYCNQTISYAQAEIEKLGQKPFNDSTASKAIEIEENLNLINDKTNGL